VSARLFVLLSAVASLKDAVVELSSQNSAAERAAALAAFRSGAARILVASDAMTRGMDIQSVANVVNYDAPIYAKTYVHRAGRTARAGRPGDSSNMGFWFRL
jgi:ATP-dependent RNA helicase DDX51/DBP6